MPIIHPQLPFEIIHSELLPRLPAKSIGRLRCVCKAWNSLLSTYDFARLHLRYQTKYKLLVLNPHSSTFRTLDHEPMDHDSLLTTTRPIPFQDHVSIIESLDGLVCVLLEKTPTRELGFWNPLTGAYKKINCTSRRRLFDDDDIRYGAFALCLDSSNDYKLVHIASDGAFVYSQRLDSWRNINNNNNTCLERYNIFKFKWLLATFIGGQVYFKIEARNRMNARAVGLRCLISFDVETEKFKEIQFPSVVRRGKHLCVSLVALNGCSHLCAVYGDSYEGLECGMWRMDGGGWMKVAVFARPSWKPMREMYTKKNGNWLAVSKDDDCFENVGLDDFATDMHAYFVGHSSHLYYRVVYVESLVSPNR